MAGCHYQERRLCDEHLEQESIPPAEVIEACSAICAPVEPRPCKAVARWARQAERPRLRARTEAFLASDPCEGEGPGACEIRCTKHEEPSACLWLGLRAEYGSAQTPVDLEAATRYYEQACLEWDRRSEWTVDLGLDQDACTLEDVDAPEARGVCKLPRKGTWTRDDQAQHCADALLAHHACRHLDALASG